MVILLRESTETNEVYLKKKKKSMFVASFQMIDQLIHLCLFFSILKSTCMLLLLNHGFSHKMKTSTYIYNETSELPSLPFYEE